MKSNAKLYDEEIKEIENAINRGAYCEIPAIEDKYKKIRKERLKK